ncbi:MAG TPA: hypothetical protein VFJ71_09180 [Candidatus Limnocylindrales bacterium]|nr:hypothetical protein [Candidatus Limnocylindrales bacterium]
MIAIDVRCDGNGVDGWTCHVALSDAGQPLTTHVVRVSPVDLGRLAPGAADPTDLVERSFRFLLDREPPSSILRAFDLPAIARYFPEYDTRIRRSPRDG